MNRPPFTLLSPITMMIFFLFLIHARWVKAFSPGDTAPLFDLPGQDGKVYKLKDYKGKWVVLEWYNEGCPFVKKHYDSGNMQKIQEDVTKQKVVWFSILSSAPGKQGHATPEQAAKLKEDKKSFATALLLDPEGKVGQAYEAKTTPHMFIIDPEGKVVYEGAIDDQPSTEQEDIAKARNYVHLNLQAALKNEKIPFPKTKPYGCAVKYK